MRTATENRDLVALLAAFCLFLSTIEYLIPKPLPFLRLGLANLAVLIALPLLSAPHMLLLILLKVIGQTLIQGSLFSYVFLFSLSSSLSSGVVMLLIHRIFSKGISLVGISIMGALASNVCQVLLAVYLVFGRNGWLIAPFLLTVGFLSSVLLGLFAQRFVRSSRWFKRELKAT